jgi:hypothetical protein
MHRCPCAASSTVASQSRKYTKRHSGRIHYLSDCQENDVACKIAAQPSSKHISPIVVYDLHHDLDASGARAPNPIAVRSVSFPARTGELRLPRIRSHFSSMCFTVHSFGLTFCYGLCSSMISDKHKSEPSLAQVLKALMRDAVRRSPNILIFR